MATKSDFSAGLGAKICGAYCDAGGMPAELNSLAENDELLRSLLGVQRGLQRIVPAEHIVDLDADPFLPEGWKVEEHKKGGGKVTIERHGDGLYIGGRKVEFYLSERQVGGKIIKGHSLREEVSKKDVLNANVLDYLLANRQLIPESWKGKWVFFWGTIYRAPGAFLNVRCLDWDGARWYWSYDYWFGGGFDDGAPAAVLASG